ncbi:uncharacterized protein LOC127279709 [Leptopilina boulardi]|uniref:uncharacterized protein LOC127279709 n=1 Tax=Leptopilina boulardi TaxID=63433 RepID=UPI0021F6401F|nr:uncharacterized protein LOC127279709 [Leptopilina boulardi]
MTTNDDLKSLLIDIKKELSGKLDTVESEIKALVKKNAARTEEISLMVKKVNKLETRNDFLENKILNCESKIDSLLNRERAKNIILFKVKDTIAENENLLKTLRDIFHHAEVTLEMRDIVATRRLGKVAGARPILVTLTNQGSKSMIFQKAVNFGKNNIRLSNDLPKEIREKRRKEHRELLDYKQLLEKQGIVVSIKGRYLVMDNKFYDAVTVSEYLSSTGEDTIVNEEDQQVRVSSEIDDSTHDSTPNLNNKKSRTQTNKKNGDNKKIKSQPVRDTREIISSYLSKPMRNDKKNESEVS